MFKMFEFNDDGIVHERPLTSVVQRNTFKLKVIARVRNWFGHCAKCEKLTIEWNQMVWQIPSNHQRKSMRCIAAFQHETIAWHGKSSQIIGLFLWTFGMQWTFLAWFNKLSIKMHHASQPSHAKSFFCYAASKHSK